MDIRVLTVADARAAIPGLCEVIIDSVEDGNSIGFLEPMSMPTAMTFWEGVVKSVELGTVALLAAVENDVVQGTVHVKFAQTENQPHRVDISKLLVHRRARGRGISRLLMTAAEEVTRTAGRFLLVLDTATGSPADSIYPHLGWNASGIIPDYAMNPDGSLVSATFYWKDLREPTA
jgi:GNAT superfamily N-acetyltransferase